MLKVGYALFSDSDSAEAAARELVRNCDEHASYSAQVHLREPLDGNALPEAATEVGRNTVFMGIGGALLFMIGGTIGGGSIDLIGFSAGLGAAFGLVAGALIGVLCGMMAGARQPKVQLRELAESLGEGKAMLTVEVPPDELQKVESIVTGLGGTHFGVC